MVEKRNDMNKIIDEAIAASIEFEELMDKTDFDSWLENDKPDELENQGQDVAPFDEFKKNKDKLTNICVRKTKNGANIATKSGDKSSLEEHFPSKLFKAKIERLNARISSKKESERNCYREALKILLDMLNSVLKLDIDKNDEKYVLILIYNDLSICYAGLKNSSMSRGYAEEARLIIEEEESYKDFNRKLRNNNTTNGADIENLEFVSSKLYDLYIVALFNKALAEKRSYSSSEAEGNFKKIIKDIEKYPNLRNFNYYSALLNLGDLYVDLGRGKEAIELLDITINGLDENDIRYCNAYIMKINALIDQTKYDDANNELYKNIIKRGNSIILRTRHRITYTGFKVLNCFVRCTIENARNDLKRNDEKKKGELNQAVKLIKDYNNIMRKRNQKGLETKAYKQLSDIYNILGKDIDVRENLIKFISKADVDNLSAFISDPTRMGNWIDKCDDLDVLESFAGKVIEVIKDKSIGNYKDLLEKIKEKITKECEDKDQLFRAERIARKINEALGEKKDIKYKKNIFKEGLAEEEIRTRLDINEKEFDSVFFERSEIKNDNHIVEMIVLRRWNSFSPGLYRESTGSLGGGYLLRINRINKDLMEVNDGVKKEENEKVENIVIDPGYNFLQNFRREGFYINDIDTIIVTHSHLDHCAELLPIMDLMYQFNKRYEDTPNKKRQRKKVNLCLSQGAYKRFSSYIEDPDWKKQLKDVIILENLHNKKCNPFKGLTISAIPTPHMDLGGVKAIGIKIEIDREKKLCLGFTGDTPWYPKIIDDFKRCDLLCVHLGSIKYQEIGYTDDRYNLKIKDKPRKISSKRRQRKEFNEKYATANHLLFFGTLDLIECCSNKDGPLIIVGEFGEELKYGLRTDLCKKLYREANNKRKKKKITDIDCLPADIGLYIGIEENATKKVRCNFCEHFVEPKEIKTFSYGREDAIHYICQTCDNTLSEIQKQAFIEHRVTRH